MRAAWLTCLAACAAPVDSDTDTDDASGPPVVTVSAPVPVVPGPGLPAGLDPNDANNNLDALRVGDRVWLAVRTAPTHFASADTRMLILSSEDEQTWRAEGEIAVGSDLREPQLVETPDGLVIYMAKLGANPFDFEPGGLLMSRHEGDGTWSEPVASGPEGFIAWRIKRMGGRLHRFGYDGGGAIYDADSEVLRIHWEVSDDGLAWTPAVGGDPVVLEGGGSETDAVLLDDGSLLAVVRNEAGDASGFGSKVCTAPADDLGTWRCVHDPRKFDSPLVLRVGGHVLLVARRHLDGADGNYDLGRSDLSENQASLAYQGAYWNAPKRCAVWQVDPAVPEVRFLVDLPSRGDTCFPEAVDVTDAGFTLYNYTNDVDGPDWNWNEGQVRPTSVVRYTVTVR